MDDGIAVDSHSVGETARQRSLAELEQRLEALPGESKDKGRVALVMRRNEDGEREILAEAVLATDAGVSGDAWSRAAERNDDAQITVMQNDVAELIADGQSLRLFGDNLFLELDLSASNLPPGSRVRAGNAILEVTPKPHTACLKFKARFGDGALRLISKRELRDRNLRGIYMRVVQNGTVRAGDPAEVISRAPPPSAARTSS